ncbi:serine protease inhibitor-domain-containing protein [Scenedesmus sp. NREL 46B-D3]|nr:serine protease inhibitor-domain-containing protein [Scenedesmus sp. NREL 46B-D3]
MAGQRIAAFAGQMLRQSSKPDADASGSFLSPLSLYIALGLALNGAGSGSETEQQIFHLLHQDKSRLLGLMPPAPAAPADVRQLTTELAGLCDSLVQQQQQQQGGSHSSNTVGSAQLIVANGVWTQGVPVHQQYAAQMLQLFQAEVREVGSADAINEWAGRATKGLITTAVPPGTAFDLVLTNAVYFKGLWEYAFKKEATNRQAFKTDGGAEVQVDMMAKRFKAAEQSGASARKVQYADTHKYQAVKLPYKGSTISALLYCLASSWQHRALQQQQHSWMLRSCWLPASTGRWGCWAGCRAAEVQGENAADVTEEGAGGSGVVCALCGQGGRLSPAQPRAVVHQRCTAKRVCDCDEEGTEAAAVTAVVMLRATAVMAATPLIRFDRPFLFMLVDDASSTPLFVGTVSDPSKSPQ